MNPVPLFSRWLAVTAILAGTSDVWAAPAITNVSLRGLQINASTMITIDGADLLPEPQLILPVPVARQTVQPGATANRVQWEVVIADGAPAGIFPLRVANSKGISSAVLVGIDRLPQLPFAAEVAALPVALHGSVAGDQRLRTTFAGQKDMRVVVDVESQRLGANLKPILRLYDARGVQVAWSPQHPTIAGDARFEATLPADGTYAVELHDLLYRAAAPSFFRLKVGAVAYADLAFPLGISRGGKGSLEFVSSNLPAGTKVEFDATAVPVPGDQPAPWPPLANLTAAQPRVIVSDHTEVVEAPAASNPPQTVAALPVGINGRIGTKGEEDRFLLEVKPGTKLQIDVLARRAGSPLDGVLNVLGEQGNGLASNDDRPGTSDPGLEFAVPGNVNKIILALRDLEGRGGPDFIYRVEVRDAAQPEFSLSLTTDRIIVPAGSSQVLSCSATRAGYNGPIQLTVEGLPSGMQLSGQSIAAGSSLGLLALTAPPNQTIAGRISIVGRGVDAAANVARYALLPEANSTKLQPWLRRDLAFAATEAAPFAVAWGASSAGEKVVQGGKYAAKLSLQRADNVAGNIRLRLLTTQVMPKKTVKENNKDVQVDDLDRALRLEGTPMFGLDVKEADVNVLVPADLPPGEWSFALVAELLTPDDKNVAQTSFTSVRTVTVAPPVAANAGPNDKAATP